MTVRRCSEASLEAAEPLAATAAVAESWLLVEVRGAWPRDVSDGAGLPEVARAAVREWLSTTPSSKLLYVRRPGRAAGPTLAFVVHAPERRGSVRRFELEALEELADVELGAGGDEHESALVLVCAHGSRDACCAQHGTAAYGELAAGPAPDDVWISSHHGGHRFAPNVLVLPRALHFGRVPPGRAAELVARALDGSIDLDHYRGRTCYEGPTQAAERAMRVAFGIERVDALELVAADEEEVCFRTAEGAEHIAAVRRALGPSVPASCGAEAEPQEHFEARVLAPTPPGDT